MSRRLLLQQALEDFDAPPRTTSTCPARTWKRFAKLDFNTRAYGNLPKSKRFAKLDFEDKTPRPARGLRSFKRFKAIARDLWPEEVRAVERAKKAPALRNLWSMTTNDGVLSIPAVTYTTASTTTTYVTVDITSTGTTGNWTTITCYDWSVTASNTSG